MSACTAPIEGHDSGSRAEQACPVHGTQQRLAPSAQPGKPPAPPRRERLSPKQEDYFANSVVNDEDGNLLRIHHGSSHESDQFHPERVGRGNDSWGNGYYFTDSESTARGYAHESRNPAANVKEFYLNLTNPIYVDGMENPSMDHIRFNATEAYALLSRHPLIGLQPNETTDDGDMNPMGDYVAEYWDRETHTPAQIDAMVRGVADQYFQDAGWVELESFFGRDHGAAFLDAMHEVTGHDGVVVDFGDIGQHYVAWSPNQAKLTANTEPDDGVKF